MIRRHMGVIRGGCLKWVGTRSDAPQQDPSRSGSDVEDGLQEDKVGAGGAGWEALAWAKGMMLRTWTQTEKEKVCLSSQSTGTAEAGRHPAS